MRNFFRLLGHLWTFPNTCVGLLFGIGGRVTVDRRNRVLVIEGGWMVAIFRRLGYAGMCVGDVVLCYDDLPVHHPAIYRHECVHAVQGRLLGPLYLPLTLLGYALGFVLYRADPHDASPLEIWADVASGNGQRNRYLRYLQGKRGNREQ